MDQDTGLVYLTTYGDGGEHYYSSPSTKDRLLVFDHDDPDLVWLSDDIGNPAGVAVASGVGYKTWLWGSGDTNVYFYKEDAIENSNSCVDPTDTSCDEITYTIYFGNAVGDPNDPNHVGDMTNVVITDYLAMEILADTEQMTISDDGTYDYETNTITWETGTLTAGVTDSVSFTVKVTTMAEPMGTVDNYVEFETDKYFTTDTTETPVCCWEEEGSVEDVIYVDHTATGYHTGTSWDNAYTNLQYALARADKGCGDEIWVAKGWYYPTAEGGDAAVSFEMIDGVGIYGGFAGNESSRDDRKYAVYKTWLSGNIDSEGDSDSTNVIEADSVGNTAVLDGFIIRDAAENGISCLNASPAISHCLIVENDDAGLYCSGSGSPIMTNSIVRNNGVGLECGETTPTILNNWIHHNTNGVTFSSGSSSAIIRNNTIVYNDEYGVSAASGDSPTISNCILWHNNIENEFCQLGNCDAVYSCITDPNDPNGVESGAGIPDGYGNISCDPLFAYDDPELYNYHLDPNSQCIDKGDDIDVGGGETDIDGDGRKYGDHVDMGADEVSCDNDVSHDTDWNGDGVINLHEFSEISAVWLLDDQDPEWVGKYDLYVDGEIDLLDLDEFVDVWLWEACWRNDGGTMMMMGVGGGMDKGMCAAQLTADEIEAAKTAKWESTREPCEPSIEEQIKELEEIIVWFEELWKTDKEIHEEFTEKEWEDFMKLLHEWLEELYGQR